MVKTMLRYIQRDITEDLKNKMVFVGGPRQVGKTTLSHNIASSYNNSVYLNNDSKENRNTILNQSWYKNADLVIFDELHKTRNWKRWIKGIYDTKPEHQQYMVTGSARLDVYKRGGDSLLGRYHYWRLHPLTIDEQIEGLTPDEIYKRLLKVGGFPEPFLANDELKARRWRVERFEKITTEDIRDFSNVRELNTLKLFIDMISNRCGQLLNINNMARDLEIAPLTAKSWLSLIEAMYIGFPVHTYTKSIERSILKKSKFYLFDNADCKNDSGAILENLIATTLLKRLHYIRDRFGYNTKLHYVRDKDGREVDFLTVIDGKIYELIEVKSSDKNISTALKYYKDKLNPMHTAQIVGDAQGINEKNDILVLNPVDYFTNLEWNRAPWLLDDFKI